MAGKNTFDLNDPRAAYANRTDLSDEEISAGLDSLWENFCVSSNYELGSVIKPIIVASALESGAVSDSDVFICDGGEQIGNDYVRCAVYPYAHGTETLGEVIQNSCNDGMMAIGRKWERLYCWIISHGLTLEAEPELTCQMKVQEQFIRLTR